MASTKTIALKLALDGEREFRAAMQAAKKESSLLNSELKTLQDKYKDNANTMEALTEKQKKLSEAKEVYEKRVKAAGEGLANATKNEQEHGKVLEELKDKLEAAREEMAKIEAEQGKDSEAYKEQAKVVNQLTEEVKVHTEAQSKAQGAVYDWRKELNQANAGLEEINSEIDKNEKYLDEAKSSADGCATSIDKYGDEVKDAATETGKLSVSLGDMVKNKLIDMAGDALMNLGQKALDAAKYVVEVGSSFEAQISKVQAISGADTGDTKRLADAAAEMGRTTMFSATQAGEALEYMAMAGWKTNEMIAALPGVMNLAASSGESLGTVSDIVTDAMTAFGMSADEAGHFADVLAVASSNANTNVSMMGETFKYVAPVAGSMGYNVEEVSEMIGLMANSGIKASQAGTSLRSIITRLATDAGASSTKLGALGTLTEELGVQFYNTDGSARALKDVIADTRVAWAGLSEEQQANYGKTIAGQNALSGWLALMNAAPGDIEKLETAIANCDGTAEHMADTMNDNLSGKLELMRSALEGLGVTLYNYISGPIQGVVSFVTDVINGITNLISPQKTELEQFIDDIAAANDEVERSIESAQKTIEGGKEKAAQIGAYQGILSDILDSCEQFNLVTLDDGTKAIVNSSGEVVQSFEGIDTSAKTTEEILDQWAAGGFNTAGIKDSSEKAKGLIGYITDEVDTVESRLDGFAKSGINTEGVKSGKTAIVQIFDDLGQEVLAYESAISETGNVQINTEGVSDGTSLMVTYFSEASGSVKTFKSDLESISGDNVHLAQVYNGFDKVEDSIKRTYHITDEFTKAKINNMIETLGDSVEGLADAWNAETGELTASHEELMRWFDTAKEVAQYKALEKALGELYDAWGEAAVNVAKADSALTSALDEYNKAAGTTYKNVEELNKSTDESELKFWELANAVYAADEANKEANEGLAEAEKMLNTTGEALKKKKDALDKEKEATEESTEATADNAAAVEDAKNKLGDLAETEEDAAEAAKELTEKEREAIDNLAGVFDIAPEAVEQFRAAFSGTDEQFAEWCQNQEDKIGELQEAYKSLIEKVQGSMDSFVTALDTSGEEGTEAIDNMLTHLEERRQALESWTSNMMTLGQMAGNGFSQALYDSLLEEGPEKGAEKVQVLIDSLNAQDGKFYEVSQRYDEALQIDSVSAATLASYSSAGKELDAAVAAGINEAQGWVAEAFGGASQVGIDGAVYIIENDTSIDSAVEGAVAGAAETAQAQAGEFASAGEDATSSMSDAITQGQDAVKDASDTMVNNAKDSADTLALTYNVTGQTVPQEFARGVNTMQFTSDNAAQKLADDAKAKVDGSTSEYHAVGEKVPGQFGGGIDARSGDATSAASEMASESVDAANRASEPFYGAGTEAAGRYAGGVAEGSGNAGNAGNELAINAANGANSQEGAFYNAGTNAAISMANGINNNAAYVYNAAYNTASQAAQAAQAALQIASPSKVMTKIGKYTDEGLAGGIRDNSDLIVKEATEAAAKVPQAMEKAMAAVRQTDPWAELREGVQKYDQAIKDAIVTTEDLKRAATTESDLKDLGKVEIEGKKVDISKLEQELRDEGKKTEAIMKLYSDRAKAVLDLSDRNTILSNDYAKRAKEYSKKKATSRDDIGSATNALRAQAATATRYRLMDELKEAVDSYRSASKESVLKEAEKLFKIESGSTGSGRLSSLSSYSDKSLSNLSGVMDAVNAGMGSLKTSLTKMCNKLDNIADMLGKGTNITIPVSLGSERLQTVAVRAVRDSINRDARAARAVKGR